MRFRLPEGPKLAISWKNYYDVTIFRHDVIIIFFDIVSFLLSLLVNSPSFMSISSLVLELWQLSFIKDWSEIRKSEKPSSKLFSTCAGCCGFEIPNLAHVSNKMLLNAEKWQGYSFYHFWVINGKPTGGWGVGVVKVLPTTG